MGDRISQVRAAMEEYFGDDARRIDHALRVTAFACRLMEDEPADPELVVATALLHDIGIREAERKHGSSAGNLQEIEGPPVAREILARLGFAEAFRQARGHCHTGSHPERIPRGPGDYSKGEGCTRRRQQSFEASVGRFPEGYSGLY